MLLKIDRQPYRREEVPAELEPMESTSRRAHRDIRPTHPDHHHDVDARWNWWIINHGSLIAAAMTVLALSMSAVFVVHGRTTSTTSAADTASVTPKVGAATAITLPELAHITVISVDIRSITTSQSQAQRPETSTTTSAYPVAPGSLGSLPLDTVATTPTPVATAPVPLTAAPTPAEQPSPSVSLAEIALILPHLQLALPATWVQVGRRVTHHAPEGAAISFQWVGPNGVTAVLQVAATGQHPTAGTPIKVHGRDATLTHSSDQITLRWPQPEGYFAALRVRGLSETDAISLADNAVIVSDADWNQLVQRARLVSPPSWDRILSDDW